jgi:hypothetical protein
MSAFFDNLPPELPALELTIEQPPPTAWATILRRARWRRRRAVAAVVAAVLVIGAVPAFALLPKHDAPVVPAHHPARSFNGVCDVPHQVDAPSGDRIVQPFRSGLFLVSPPGTNIPAVSAAELLKRVERRGELTIRPGTQLRYGLVRRVGRNGEASKPQLRWILTACGIPAKEPKDLQSAVQVRPGVQVPQVTVLRDELLLLSDSGAQTDGDRAATFRGICDTRLDVRGSTDPDLRRGFHVGEITVSPAERRSYPGRDKVLMALRNRFPGTQVRLGLVQPLHAVGRPELRWVATTCGLDGGSVRPRLPGVVDEALVYDMSGHLLAEHRSGPQSEAEQAIRNAPPLPTPLPTYVPPGPNQCFHWIHAYKPFVVGMTAAGFTSPEGCVMQKDIVVVYLSSTHGAVAAVSARAGDSMATDQGYQQQRVTNFPWAGFRLVAAPDGATKAHVLRFLSRTVAEVELSGPGLAPRSYKFDSASLNWLDCADRTATLQPCRGR